MKGEKFFLSELKREKRMNGISFYLKRVGNFWN
jgi:hypothetical protein